MLSIFYDVIHIFLSKASSNTQIDSRAGGIGGARVPIFTPNILQIHYPYSNMGGGADSALLLLFAPPIFQTFHRTIFNSLNSLIIMSF